MGLLPVFPPSPPCDPVRDERAGPQPEGQADQDPGGDGGSGELPPHQEIGSGHAEGEL